MSVLKPIAADEQSVLMAFALEPSHSRETLERYVKEYPQHALALIDCSIDILRENAMPNAAEAAVPESAVNKAWERFERAVQQPEAELVNPFARLTTSALKALAKRMDVSNLFVLRLRDRLIIAGTVPSRFVERLAAELGATATAVRTYLEEPPGVASGGPFRSGEKPAASDMLTFEQAISTSQLSLEQQASLRALLD